MISIEPFYDPRTSTVTYVVYDPVSHDAVIIDPVLDYDPVGSKTWTESVDVVIHFVKDRGLTPHYVLETHAHADHLSGAQRVKRLFPEVISAISHQIRVVQETFKKVFDLPADFPTDGSQFDRLVHDNEVIVAGSIAIRVIATPGHTPACITYQIEDAVFVGDAIFMPDMGTGRCDFPAGCAEDLYDSITTRLYTLADETRVFVGHDYQPGGREFAFETTIAEQKQFNVQLAADTTKQEYIKFRTERDVTLAPPKLLYQSVQINIDAGSMPGSNKACQRYLKIPINVFRPEPGGDMEIGEIGGPG